MSYAFCLTAVRGRLSRSAIFFVFPCGYTLGDDGDAFNLYYGAADTSICLATGSVSEMLDWLRKNCTDGDPAALD